jgi:hypothetical protein
MNKINKFFGLLVILFIAFYPSLLMAQDNASNTGDSGDTTGTGVRTTNVSYNITIDNPFKSKTIPALVESIIKEILIPIGAVVAVVMIIFSGFLFVTAQGNETQITKAKESLKWALIGSAILLGAWVISEVIQGTINELKKS